MSRIERKICSVTTIVDELCVITVRENERESWIRIEKEKQATMVESCRVLGMSVHPKTIKFNYSCRFLHFCFSFLRDRDLILWSRNVFALNLPYSLLVYLLVYYNRCVGVQTSIWITSTMSRRTTLASGQEGVNNVTLVISLVILNSFSDVYR